MVFMNEAMAPAKPLPSFAKLSKLLIIGPIPGSTKPPAPSASEIPGLINEDEADIRFDLI